MDLCHLKDSELAKLLFHTFSTGVVLRETTSKTTMDTEWYSRIKQINDVHTYGQDQL